MPNDAILPLAPSSSIEMLQDPQVSIVVPTYNKLSLLRPCLESIRNYTDMSRVEVIVVSNGCTDGTSEYLKTLPAPFRSISHKEPLGFPKAINAGVAQAKGDFLVLLNNDTVLLEQPRHAWMEMLLAPFKADAKTGITGPVKFSWDCGGVERRAMAFWCVMIERSDFLKLGPLDEAFGPGMGEDGDFSIKMEEAGYKLVQVPEDGVEVFGKGIPKQTFPIFHKGSGTFGEKDYSDVQKTNDAILVARYGKNADITTPAPSDNLESVYQQCLVHPCDTNELFPTLRKYAEGCSHLTEFGVRGVFTTWAFLSARPKRLVSYDIEYCANIEGAKKEALRAGISFDFQQESTLEATIEETDFLFIDTKHTYLHLKAELDRHAGRVKKYIAIHDVESFGLSGEDGGPGELQAITEFLAAHPEWSQKEHLTISNGLMILERNKVAISIIIPTCGKDWENVLKRCVERVLDFTKLPGKEIIVVANGAPPEALAYLKTKPVQVAPFQRRLGYIGAVNVGIHLSGAEFVVLLDDDSFLMLQDADAWIHMLRAPFRDDPKMGAAGPFGQTYDDLGQVLHSGCTMYRTEALREVDAFDEAFQPGYLGDEDLSIRLRKAGWKLERVPKGHEPKYVDGVFQIQFPVLHTGTVNTMDKHGADLPLVVKNRKLLYERHIMYRDASRSYSGPAAAPAPSITRKPTISIVIPTFNHLNDLLQPAIASILEYTDMDAAEVIVVANGCTDGTEDYVRTLGDKFKLLSFEDALGYTRATNEGLKVATGDFLILFNNDVVLLGQPKNQWIEILLAPFQNNPKMGITGPLQLHDDYADQDVIIGFCLCISRPALEACGGLMDEIYSPGGGEDIDLCCKAKALGYITRQVPQDGVQGKSNQNTGNFPIWHVNNQTFKDIPEYTRFIVKKNGLVNARKYNKNLKLNLGSGGIEYPEYLSVDLLDRRASIIMDVTKLDFPENSVSEIMASHLFEHLNPYHALDILKGWHKILKPGGKLTMEMPDIEQLCKRFVAANTGVRYGILNAVYGSVNTTGDGDPSNITSPHLFGWWPQSIADHLMNAGFIDIVFGPEIWPHPESNLHVEARKP